MYSLGVIYMWSDLQQFKADFFKALSHPLRIRILELLSEGEKSVHEIQEILTSEGSAVSQQLSVLRSKNIVVGRKEGKNVLYSLRDPSTVDLLNVARELFNNHLIDTLSMYEELEDQKNSKKKKGL
jgi:DNA-binding transcriptional ArsR family regulator